MFSRSRAISWSEVNSFSRRQLREVARRRHYDAGRQPLPRFTVANLLLSTAVTVADDPSSAVTPIKFSCAGARIFSQLVPSLVRKILPSLPTSQQIFAPGAAPALSLAFGLTICPSQVAPPSVVRSTNPPPASRNLTEASGVGITNPTDRSSISWTS